MRAVEHQFSLRKLRENRHSALAAGNPENPIQSEQPVGAVFEDGTELMIESLNSAVH
jgi:hypothetical protein